MSGAVAGGSLLVAGGLLAGLPVLVLGSAAPPPDQVCAPTSPGSGTAAAPTTLAGAVDLDQTQLRHAATIIAEGHRRRLPDQAIVVALATGLQESRLRVYANDGTGADLAPDQHGIAWSLRLRHDAVGTDHGSLGVFQQQWPWWGTMRELMDPATSAGLFYQALTRIKGWESLPVTVAAQTVQHSAHPHAYADDEPLARRLFAELGDGTVGVGDGCANPPGGGAVRFPLPTGSGYVDQSNFGDSGAVWAAGHTGTDLSVACGTPVLAATSGTVRIRTDQVWSGRWLVQVSTGPGKLTTWYAHMQHVTVADGEQVAAGQQIGQVGSEGNSSGCHLHFEIHPRGGGIYRDPIDPTRWLRERVGNPVPAMGADGVRRTSGDGPSSL